VPDQTRFAALPHDAWYDDWTWSYIFGEVGDTGAVNHGNLSYEGIAEFDPTQVAEVELWHVEEGSYGPEHSAAGLFRLSDNSYVVFTAWCDSTGWGCQDDARVTFHASRDDAVWLGFGDEERRWFGIETPPERSAVPDASAAVLVIEETLRRLNPQASGIIHISRRIAAALEEAGLIRA
jgi:hypothetical protein